MLHDFNRFLYEKYWKIRSFYDIETDVILHVVEIQNNKRECLLSNDLLHFDEIGIN